MNHVDSVPSGYVLLICPTNLATLAALSTSGSKYAFTPVSMVYRGGASSRVSGSSIAEWKTVRRFFASARVSYCLNSRTCGPDVQMR